MRTRGTGSRIAQDYARL